MMEMETQSWRNEGRQGRTDLPNIYYHLLTPLALAWSNALERKQECSKVWKVQRNHILMLAFSPFLVVSEVVTWTLCRMSTKLPASLHQSAIECFWDAHFLQGSDLFNEARF